MDSDLTYMLLMVIGLPVLLLLLTGPGMWSEKWGWGTLERLERGWNRLLGRKARNR